MPPAADAIPNWSRLWAVVLAAAFLSFFFANEADNDLWGHVLFGGDMLSQHALPRTDTYSYTATGAPWVNHEWLAQVLFALAYRVGGSSGLLLLKVALAAATCAAGWALIRRRTAAAWVWGPAGVLLMAVLSRGFAIRPQIFTYAATACTLWILDDPAHRGRRLWVVPALLAVWVNVHGGFIVGLALLGGVALWTTVTRQRGARRLWVALAAALPCTALNPYGAELPVYVWRELSRDHPITEWQPVAVGDPSQWAFVALLVLFLLTLPWLQRWRADGWLGVVALGAAGLALRHQRHTPLFAVCVAAPLAAHLDAVARGAVAQPLGALSRAAQRLLGAGLVGLVAVQLWIAGARWYRDGLALVFAPRDYPVGAVHALADAAQPLHLALPLEWGEYAIWFLAPRVKVSLDGRFATVYPESVVQDNFDFFAGAPGWRRLLEHYPTDAVLLPTAWPNPIRHLADWQRVCGDDVAEVWVRTDRAARLRPLAAPAAGAPATFP